MGEVELYRALRSYTPISNDDGTLDFQKDDLFEICIQRSFSRSESDKPGYLFAYNLRTKKSGYIPVEFVILVGSEVNNTIHHPSAPGLEVVEDYSYKSLKDLEHKEEHKFNDVYFLTPILCKHYRYKIYIF